VFRSLLGSYSASETGRIPIMRKRVDFGNFARRVDARKQKEREEEGTGDAGLQRATGIDVNEDFLTSARVRVRNVSDNPRRIHADVLFAPRRASTAVRLTACRYVSQPCCILPSISSLTSF